MPVDTEALFQAVVMLAEIEEMQITVTNSVLAGIATGLAGCGAFLLMGPAGFLVGSTAAGLTSYLLTRNKFKPVFAIMKEDLTPQQQQKLIDTIRKAFENFDATDVAKILAFFASQQELHFQLLNLLKAYLLQTVLSGVASYNNVDLKSKEGLMKYEEYAEEYRKSRQLDGMVFPPLNGSGWTPTAAPGWEALREAVRVPPNQPTFPSITSGVVDPEQAVLPNPPQVPQKATF